MQFIQPLTLAFLFLAIAPAPGVLTAWTYLGGDEDDAVGFNDCLELTPQGKPVVIGIAQSRCFPLVNPVFPLHSKCPNGATNCLSCPPATVFDPSFNDVFVAKFSVDLSQLEFSTYLGGNQREEPAGLAVDRVGNIFLTGETASSNFPLTASRAFDSSFTPMPPTTDWNMAFIVKINSTSSTLDYSSFIGGDLNCSPASQAGTRGRSLTLLPTGDVLISGVTTTCDFPTTPSVAMPASLGGNDGFITVHAVN